MNDNETGCQSPDRPILCVNNCGFFGRAATRNMCSKCYRETVLKEEQERLAVSSFDNIVNGTSTNGKEAVVAAAVSIDLKSEKVSTKDVNVQVSTDSSLGQPSEPKKSGPNRCLTCRKRVGLTGFSCRCGNLFCAAHRYSDKHDCQFDYQAAAQSAIAKANPVIKAEKLDKI
ncbi:zinc finger A20 and AN1 domain-containing stress-associated protein 8-like [Amaranthus tricolor]|uniref:zinc finger A20 and AN1 domain-containing stress-associated protein 8-like n=1 Tax=Amaranthus tricolor TaxID=29722 RepID=UPI002587EDA2|nr:zinc finger A20 and AN1 domain-containing stress-associated protein 8-like [Amaranthus tricolor]XP_057520311.1 zinc finger A20 and AN1 domain-containing stress-associated protein 8-like [Amaranthus tricolor]